MKQNENEFGFIINSLLAISSQDYQIKVWYQNEGREKDDYEERTLNFEADLDCLKDLLRETKIRLASSQLRAILRVHVMVRRFDRLLEQETLSSEHSQLQLQIINHSYWAQVREQAGRALSLLGIDRLDLSDIDDAPTRDLSTEGRFRKLDGRIKDTMVVFGDPGARERTWKSTDDFWMSAISYNKTARKFFNGFGCLSSGQHLRAFMAFNHTLREFCNSYEDDSMVTLKQIISDPRFREVEQKAQDYIKLVARGGLEPPTYGL